MSEDVSTLKAVTMVGALAQVIRLSKGEEVVLQNRDTDIYIRCVNSEAGHLMFRWWSERLERWELSRFDDLIDNTANFPGPFEVRRA